MCGVSRLKETNLKAKKLKIVNCLCHLGMRVNNIFDTFHKPFTVWFCPILKARSQEVSKLGVKLEIT